MIIYKVVNSVNKKVYVGQTTRPLSHRWTQHLRDANNRDYPLYRAIKKYGVENFRCEKIDSAACIDDLNKKEQYWIEVFNSCKEGYNILPGGKNRQMPEAVRQKISKALTGKKQNQRISKEEKSLIAKANGSKALKNLDGLIKFRKENPEFARQIATKAMQSEEKRKHLSLMAKRQFSQVEAREKLAIAKGSNKLFEVRDIKDNVLLYRGFNQTECARTLKVSPASVRNWLFGIKKSKKYSIYILKENDNG